MTIVTNTYTSNTTVNIPSTAFDVTITVRSASGGTGVDSRGNGPGGTGRRGTFTFKTNYVARTLQIRIGQPGGNGTWTTYDNNGGSRQARPPMK